MAGDSHDPQMPRTPGASELDALRRGDADAFNAVVRANHRALLAVARGIVGSDDAEEIVQIAWIKAFQGIAGFEGRAKLRTWLTSIVLNEARMHLRRLAREPRMALDDTEDPFGDRFDARGGWSQPPLAWRSPRPEDALMQEQFAECLGRILDALPAQQRLVLELRDVQGLSLETIGAELGLAAGNVRVLLHRARAKMYQAIEHFEVSGEC